MKIPPTILEAVWTEEALACGAGELAQTGASPGVCEGIAVVSLALRQWPLLLGRPGLLQRTFPVGELLPAVPSGYLFTADSSPLPGSALQTPRLRAQFPSAPRDT